VPPQPPPATTPPAGPPVRTEGDRILLPGNIVFDTGRAILSPTPENQTVLTQLKQFLVDNPKVTTLRIEGYTDNVGQPDANLKLSGERAVAIKQWLVANGVSADRIIAVGFGQEKPIADNSTPAARAQNRRTEFKIAAVNNRPYRGVPINGGGTEFK
jgi:OOP family OmpA-OmpF porin